MTDKKISELVAVTTVEDTDEFVVARAGASNKITGANLATSVGGGGGSSPLLWTAFDSLVGGTITAGTSGIIDFGACAVTPGGTLTTVTVGDDGGDPAILIEDAGCYLVSLATVAGDDMFANTVDPALLYVEIQVFNSEADPWLVLPVYESGGSHAAFGVLSHVLNVSASDPVLRGFTLFVYPRATDFTPGAVWAQLKIVQLATAT